MGFFSWLNKPKQLDGPRHAHLCDYTRAELYEVLDNIEQYRGVYIACICAEILRREELCRTDTHKSEPETVTCELPEKTSSTTDKREQQTSCMCQSGRSFNRKVQADQ